MDNKENLCNASESRSDSSHSSQAMASFRRAKKSGGGCNLRKSLAWNKAFFIEEGFLDPLELSVLTGSSSKSSVSGSASKSSANGSTSRPNTNFVSIINGENSSSTNDSIRSRPNQNGRMHQGSVLDEKKDVDLFSGSESSVQKERMRNGLLEEAMSQRGNSRNIPRAPAVLSQKRLASHAIPNQVSKLPKFATMKSQTSLASASKSGISTRRQSNQNVKPAETEMKSRAKSSCLALKETPNCPTSHARTSGNVYEKKSVNGNTVLTATAETAKLESGKYISCFQASQSHLPTILALPGGLNLENTAHSSSENYHDMGREHPYPQVEGKPTKLSSLRIPTPSLGFFCQAKNSQSSVHLPKEPRRPSGCDYSNQSPEKSKSQKLVNALETLNASSRKDQPCLSDFSVIEVASTVVSTPLTSKSTYVSPNIPRPFTNTRTPYISQEDTGGRLLRYATEPPIVSTGEKKQKRLHFGLFMGEDDTRKQSGKQKSGYVPDFSSNLVLPTGNSSLLSKEKLANTLSEVSPPTMADGNYLLHEYSNLHSSANGNFMSPHYSSKQPEQIDCRSSQSGMSQQLEDISAGNACSPGAKGHLFSGLISGNKEKDMDGCPMLEEATYLRFSEMQAAGSASLKLANSSTENLILSREDQTMECALYDIGQHRLDCNTILPDEVGHTESAPLDYDMMSPKLESNIASVGESEVTQSKQEIMEKMKEANSSLKRLKSAPYSDEWLAALESFGEDVLQMKSGAVQNSPQDKATPELGPWSPVKRKTQDIGPYDCTKYSTTGLSSASRE